MKSCIVRIRRYGMAAMLAIWAAAIPASNAAIADDGWEAIIHVERILQLDAFKEIMEAHLGEDADEVHELASEYSEVIGLNPFTDIVSIRARGSLDGDDWDELEDSVQSITIDVKQTGNLEGLLLALDDYSSSRLDGHQVHHFSVDEIGDVYVAFVERGSGSRVILTRSEAMMGEVLEQSPSDSDRSRRQGSDQLLHLSVGTTALSDFAAEELNHDVPKFVHGIIGSIRRLTVDIASASGSENVELVARLEIDDEERLDQLVQLAQAGVAFGKLALSEEDHEREIAGLIELLESVSIDEHEGSIEIKLEASWSDLMSTALDF